MGKTRRTPGGLRVSYSMISLWKRGDMEGFLNYVNGESFEPTTQMLEGSAMDKKAADVAVQTKRLIPEFGWFELKAPVAHLKLESKIEWEGVDPFILVGELDIYDNPDIYELKTGSWSSGGYAKTLQTKIYLILATLHKLPVKRILVCHYNQYTNDPDIHVVLPSKRMILSAMKDIKQTVEEIQAFLKNMDQQQGK